MQIKPLHDRILIKRTNPEKEEIRGEILIPDTAKEKPQKGEIVAVGEGKVLDNGEKMSMSVKVGDRVLFARYAGSDVKIEDEEYLIMREDEVLGILEGK